MTVEILLTATLLYEKNHLNSLNKTGFIGERRNKQTFHNGFSTRHTEMRVSAWD